MGKYRFLVYILLIVGCIAFIPTVYFIANLPEVRVTTWGIAFSDWFNRTVIDVMSVIEDADELTAGWELWIVGLVIFLIPLSILGLASFFDTVRTIRKRSMMVEGVVSESVLSEKQGEYTTVYNVTITYQFNADGKEYKNATTVSDMWSNILTEHQNRLEQYPPGTKLMIKYEPGNPDNHIILQLNTRSNAWIVIPLIFVIGIYALFSWLSGFFLALYLNHFPGFTPDDQWITSICLAGLLVVFCFYAIWLYKKVLSGDHVGIESAG